MRIKRLLFSGAFAAASFAQESPRLDSIVNSASGRPPTATQPTLGVGGWATIKGAFPITAKCEASSQQPDALCTPPEYCQAQSPLPEELCGVSVEADGVKLPILYVDKGQVNVVLPARANNETRFKAYVQNRASNELRAPVTNTGVGIFHDGKKIAVAFLNDDRMHSRDNPFNNALPDDGRRNITILTTGAGLPEQAMPQGMPTPYEQTSPTPKPTFSIDGVELPDAVRESIAAPGYIAVQQHTIAIPAEVSGTPLAEGAHTIELCVTQGTKSCDKADFLIGNPEKKYVSQKITLDDRGRETVPEGTVTLTDRATGEAKTTKLTAFGNILIEKPDDAPADLVIAAGKEFAEYRDTIKTSIPAIIIPQFQEFAESKFTYYPDRYESSCEKLQISGQVACHKWAAEDRPMNNIEFSKYTQSGFTGLEDKVEDRQRMIGASDLRWPDLPIKVDLRLADAPSGQVLLQWVLDKDGNPVRAITKPLPEAFREIVGNFTINGRKAFEIIENLGEEKGIHLSYNRELNSAICKVDEQGLPTQCRVNLYPDPNAIEKLGQVLQHELIHALGAIHHDPEQRSVFYYAVNRDNGRAFTSKLPQRIQSLLDTMYLQPQLPKREQYSKDNIFLKLHPPRQE